MEVAIERARQANGTASYVLDVVTGGTMEYLTPINQQSSTQFANRPSLSLVEPTDCSLYFNALLSSATPTLSPGGVVGLLSITASQFVPKNNNNSNNNTSAAGVSLTRSVSSEQRYLYLRAVALHTASLLSACTPCDAYSINNTHSHVQLVHATVIPAVGYAAQCLDRDRVLNSGIVTSLQRLAIGLGRLTLEKDDTNDSVLTAAHTEYLQCSLRSGQYDSAAAFVDAHPIYRVAGSGTSPNSSSKNSSGRECLMSMETYLRYFYLRGLIYAGCPHRWMDVVDSCDLCLTAPHHGDSSGGYDPQRSERKGGHNHGHPVVSAVAIAARKKGILAKCLALCDDCDAFEISGNSGGGGVTDIQSSTLGSKSISLNANERGPPEFEAPARLIANNQKPAKVTENGADSLAALISTCPLLSLPPSCSQPVVQFFASQTSLAAPNGAGGDSNPQQQGMSSVTASLQRRNEDIGAPDTAYTRPTSSGRGNNNNGALTPSVLQTYQLQLSCYYEVVVAFTHLDTPKLQSLLEKHAELFRTDGNYGLITQMQRGLIIRRIQKVARVYSVINIGKLATKIGLHQFEVSHEMEARLLEMNADRERMEITASTGCSAVLRTCLSHSYYHARIDPETQTVEFVHCDVPQPTKATANSSRTHSANGSFNPNAIFDDEIEETKVNVTAADMGVVVDTEASKRLARITQIVALTERVQSLDIDIATSTGYQLAMNQHSDKDRPHGVADFEPSSIAAGL